MHKKLVVLLALVASALVVSAPLIGDELPTDAPVQAGPIPGQQQLPQVAFDGTHYFVVWTDTRAGNWDVYGARVTPEGIVVDPLGIPLATGPLQEDEPRVAFNGTEYLVVWEEFNGSTMDVAGVRVGKDGAIRGGKIMIGGGSCTQYSPTVASDGVEWLVAWRQEADCFGGGGYRIYMARVNALGQPVSHADGSVFKPISTASTTQDSPTATFDGTHYVVVWEDERNGAGTRDIYGTRLDRSALRVDYTDFAVTTAPGRQWRPWIAASPQGYLVTWRDERVGGQHDVYAAFVERSTLAAVEFPVAAEVQYQGQPTVSFDGSEFLVVWYDSRLRPEYDVYGARVSSTGALLDAGGVPLLASTSWELAPVPVPHPDGWFLAYSDQVTTGVIDVRATTVARADLSTGAPFTVSNGANWQNGPAVGFDGTNYLLVWSDNRGGAGYDLYAVRIAPGGGVLEATATPVITASGDQYGPAIAFDGTDYFLVWTDTRSGNADLYGARLSTAGSLVPGSEVALKTAGTIEQGPALDWNGTHHLVAWTDYRGGTGDVYAMRVSQSGAPGAELPLAVKTSEQGGAAVLHDGAGNFLVAWHDFSSGSGDLYLNRIDPAGNLLHGATGKLLHASSNRDTLPALATDGTQFFVAWQKDNVSGANHEIFGARVALDGTVTDAAGFAISRTSNDQVNPAVAFDGTNFVALWEHNRRYGVWNSISKWDLYAARVSPAGAVLDPAGGSVVSLLDEDERSVQVLAGGSGKRLLAAYQRFSSAPDALTTRVFARQLTLNEGPTAQNANVATAVDTPVSTTLVATDFDGDPLTFSVVSGPTSGTLGGTLPDLTYTPDPGFSGTDVLVFRATDPAGAPSNLATVTFNVGVANNAPVALDQAVTTDEDVALDVTLTAADETSTPTFTLVTAPTSGSVTLRGAIATYRPQTNVSGSFSFTFRANDGSLDSSNVGTISITVNPVADAPRANNLSITASEETNASVRLTGSDPDGTTPSFVVLTNPVHGTLTGTPPNLVYRGAANYWGPDSFTYEASDGALASAPATVTLNVRNVNDPPTAANGSFAGTEDIQLPMTLVGSDIDSGPLSFIVVTQPASGTVSGTGASWTYTPNAGFNGSDSFTFRARDDSGVTATQDSNLATITLSIAAVDDPPGAESQVVSLPEDSTKAITLTGSDEDGTTPTFELVSNPTHGTLTGTPPDLTYTPEANYFGPDSFLFRTRDATSQSPDATVSLDVTPVNDAPVADELSASTTEDTSVDVVLTGSDLDSALLTFSVVGGPANGNVTGVAPNVRYTPAPNSSGSDSFTYRVTDGDGAFDEATVTVTVSAVNDAPVADDGSASTAEDTAVVVTLTGSDVDDASLGYEVLTVPANGVLSGVAPDLTYTPSPNFTGSDALTFRVSDGKTSSAAATFSLTVTPVNDAPVANELTANTSEDTAVDLVLTGSDVESASLTFEVLTAPSGGTLSGAAPNLRYTPAANFNGADSFTFRVGDGAAFSSAATVTLDVAAVNDPPVADAASLTTAEEVPLDLVLTGSDPDGDPVGYQVVDVPLYGVLSGVAPNLTYTPNPDFTGADAFTFRTSDGTTSSATVTVDLTVTEVNDAPVAQDAAATSAEGAAVQLTLAATDVDGDALTFEIVSPPAYGTLSGTGAVRTYTPNAGYAGPDTLTFRATDGEATSNLATISVTVSAAPITQPPPEEPPPTGCGCAAGGSAEVAWALLSLAAAAMRRTRRRA